MGYHFQDRVFPGGSAKSLNHVAFSAILEKGADISVNSIVWSILEMLPLKDYGTSCTTFNVFIVVMVARIAFTRRLLT